MWTHSETAAESEKNQRRTEGPMGSSQSAGRTGLSNQSAGRAGLWSPAAHIWMWSQRPHHVVYQRVLLAADSLLLLHAVGQMLSEVWGAARVFTKFHTFRKISCLLNEKQTDLSSLFQSYSLSSSLWTVKQLVTTDCCFCKNSTTAPEKTAGSCCQFL